MLCSLLHKTRLLPATLTLTLREDFFKKMMGYLIRTVKNEKKIGKDKVREEKNDSFKRRWEVHGCFMQDEWYDEAYREEARRAGRILKRVFNHVLPMVKPGVLVREIILAAEEAIRDAEAGEAFPPQVSVNETAAHDTAMPEDERTIPEEGVVKLDMGVHVSGVIADAARSIALGREAERLVKSVREAYAAGREWLMRDASVGEIGRVVSETLREHGVNPIVNLSGHGLARWTVHADPQIPNIPTSDARKPAVHTAFEPFGSLGAGRVQEHGTAEVFQAAWPLRTRDMIIRRAEAFFRERHGLPFSRWQLARVVGAPRAAYILQRLRQEGLLVSYPPLRDSGWVAQWEDSFIRTEHGWENVTGDE